MAAAETAATETAATETAAAEAAAGGGGGADSGRGGNRCGSSRRSVVCFRKYRISGSTSTHKCLPTYIEFYLCICKIYLLHK